MIRWLSRFCMLLCLCLAITACIAPLEGGDMPDTVSQVDAQPAPAEAGEETDAAATSSTPALIDAAYEAGTISQSDRILYLTYAVYEPESLPEEYVSTAPWHGTLVVREIKDLATTSALCDLPPDVQTELFRLVQGAYQCN